MNMSIETSSDVQAIPTPAVIDCILMQGIPGSGKTTLAKQLVEQSSADLKVILCAADYFYVNGVYQFNKYKLSEYYSRVMMEFAALTARFIDAYNMGDDKRSLLVIIDNVNIAPYAIKPYFSWISQLQRQNPKTFMDFKLMEPDTPWKYDPEECVRRSIHAPTVHACQEHLMELLRHKNWELPEGRKVNQYDQYTLRKPRNGSNQANGQ